MADLSVLLKGLNSKTVLGINPPVFDFAWFDLWSKPLGLLYLLEYLRGNGNSVHLVDSLYESRLSPISFGRWKVKKEKINKPEPYENIPRNYYRFGLSPEEFEQKLLSAPKPDLILVTSAMTYWYPGVFEAISIAKKIFPGVPVLLGGAYAVLCHEHAQASGADMIQTVPFSICATRPALDLYDAPRYGVVMSSRGCPMNCEYCASRKLWNDFQQRNISEIMEELRFQLSIKTVRDIAFYDDALLLDKERRFYPLCEAARSEFPGVGLHTPNGLHVAQIDDTCAHMLFDSGFHTIRLSLEGIDELTSSASGDKTGTLEYKNAVDSLLRAGYPHERIETYILVGLPGQKIESVERSIDYVKSLGGKPKLAEFSPIPGTVAYSESLKSCPAIAKEPLLHNNSIYVPYFSGLMEEHQLQSLKNRAR